MEQELEERTVTAHDKCDKCGFQAYYLAIFDSGELYFCYHHFNKNEEAIREMAYYLIDESEKLFGTSNV